MTESRMRKIIAESLKKVRDAIPHKEVSVDEKNTKTFFAYKQFRIKLDKKTGKNLAPGYVFPLYIDTNGNIDKNVGLKIGKWYKAGEGAMYVDENGRVRAKGGSMSLSYRPGWHATNTPWGNQRGAGKIDKSNIYTQTWNDEVWAKIEIVASNDRSDFARTQEGGSLKHLDDDDYYSFKTNSNAPKEQSWWIADKMRIVEIMDDDSVDATNKEYYEKLSAESGREIQSDPIQAAMDSENKVKSEKIKYWKMPRSNGKRYTRQDIADMGYSKEEQKNESKTAKKTVMVSETQLRIIIAESVKRILQEGTNSFGCPMNADRI